MNSPEALRRKWLKVPGVSYIAPAPQNSAPQLTNKKHYTSTRKLAAKYGISRNVVYAQLSRREIPSIMVDQERCWLTNAAAKILQARPTADNVEPSAGWLPYKEACAKAGISRATIDKLVDRGIIRSAKACMPNASGRSRLTKIYNKADLVRYICERAAREQAEAENRAEMMAFKQSRRQNRK